MANLNEGEIFHDKYRIIGIIGEGGMGTVYEAEHVRLNRKTAIKVIKPNLKDDMEANARFSQEATALASLDHPNIVTIYDFGFTPDGLFFQEMEFLQGMSLKALLSTEGRLPVEQALKIATQLYSALTAIHRKNIIHRDLKPENIFIVKDNGYEKVKVLDFGIIKLEGQALTQAGRSLGTPCYMSPEQARGSKNIDHRSDLFSIGTILYEMLTGIRPFDAETLNEIMVSVIRDEPVSLDQYPDLDIPAEIQDFLDQVLQKEPEKRPKDAKTCLNLLKAIEVNLLVTPTDDEPPPNSHEVHQEEEDLHSAEIVTVGDHREEDAEEEEEEDWEDTEDPSSSTMKALIDAAYQKGSGKRLWLSLAVLLVLIIGGIIGVLTLQPLFNRSSSSTESIVTTGATDAGIKTQPDATLAKTKLPTPVLTPTQVVLEPTAKTQADASLDSDIDTEPEVPAKITKRRKREPRRKKSSPQEPRPWLDKRPQKEPRPWLD